MFIRFFKGQPNSHVVLFRNGEVIREGQGLNFWYLPMASSIAVVPSGSQDAPFIFKLPTADYQEITLQGSFTYRVDNPSRLSEMLDFTIDPSSGAYASEDPDRLIARVVSAVQAEARAMVATYPLRKAMTTAKGMSGQVLKAVQALPALEKMGIEIEGLNIVAVKASPEMQKALEADYREQLHREADMAIYARRAAAVEEERKIQERELNTEVELENQRKELVDTQARNKLTLAEAEAKAEEMKLDPYGKLPQQTLIGLALKEWAANAGMIENLSITPDMLSGLAGWINGKGKAA